jgi:preprotein translocase subunit SecF
MRLFKKTNINFIRFGRAAFVFSFSLVVISAVSLILHKGPNLSVDFSGGLRIDVKFLNRITTDQLGEMRTSLQAEEVHTIGMNEDEVQIQKKGAELAKSLTQTVLTARDERGSFKNIDEVLALPGMEQVNEEYVREVFTVAEVTEEKASKEGTEATITHKGNINALSDSALLERMQEVVVKDTSAKIEKMLESIFPSEGYVEGKKDLNHMEQMETLVSSFGEALGSESRGKEIAEAVFHYRHLDDPVAGIRLVPSFDELASFANLDSGELAKIKDNFFIRQFEIRGTEIIGPRVSGEIAKRALYGLGLAFLLMLIYIAVRFDIRMAIMAIIALFHDVFITLGLCSVLNLEMSMTLIAAFLTVVGYSINDTVVYYDRIREGLSQQRKESYAESLNRCVNENLSRTMLTGLSSLMVLTVLLFVGGQALRDFAIVMISGIVFGTYSSVYVAAPLLIEWNNFRNRRGKLDAKRRMARGVFRR